MVAHHMVKIMLVIIYKIWYITHRKPTFPVLIASSPISRYFSLFFSISDTSRAESGSSFPRSCFSSSWHAIATIDQSICSICSASRFYFWALNQKSSWCNGQGRLFCAALYYDKRQKSWRNDIVFCKTLSTAKILSHSTPLAFTSFKTPVTAIE